MLNSKVNMKYLKNFNESIIIDDNILEDIKDICLELEDNDFQVIYVEIPHYDLTTFVGKTKKKLIDIEYGVAISKPSIPQALIKFGRHPMFFSKFNPSEVNDVVHRIRNYMNSIGYRTKVEYQLEHNYVLSKRDSNYHRWNYRTESKWSKEVYEIRLIFKKI